jgi:hypothetical protein
VATDSCGFSFVYSTIHNDKESIDEGKTLTIVHPFHPENGKKYEILELVHSKGGDRVRCLDEQGELRIFSVNITNQCNPTDHERLTEGGCIVSADDLVSLKKLVDALNTAT